MAKKTIQPGILLLGSVIFMFCTKNPNADLRILYEQKKYFDLRDSIQLFQYDSSDDILFYKGVVSSTFNQPVASIDQIQRSLKNIKEHNDNERLIACYDLLAENHLKTYHYAAANDFYRILLTDCMTMLDSVQEADYKNMEKITHALREISPQSVTFHGDSRIETPQGYVPMKINGKDISLGFDSGADFSGLMRSMAQQLGIEIIDADIQVGGISGNDIVSDLGVASDLKIGNASLQNVVFLIFEDKDLYIPQADMQIEGFIGFPVFVALREITFYGNRSMSIPAQPHTFDVQNLCFNQFSPLIAGIFDGKRHIFCFDTGAGKTLFYRLFYETYAKEVETNYPIKIEKVIGVGDYRDIPAYAMSDVTIDIAGKHAYFREIPVLTEYTLDESHFFYGNIGRDLVDQFEKYTINFESMSLILE